jgi:hypothetical protein
MTTFIQVDSSLTHAGLDRVATATLFVSNAFRRLRLPATLLLGGVVAAMVVVVDRFMVNFADGGLLLGWMVLWGLTFVALAFAGSTGRSLSIAAANDDSGAKQSASRIPDVAMKPGRNAERQATNSTPACDWDQWRPIKDVGDNTAY